MKYFLPALILLISQFTLVNSTLATADQTSTNGKSIVEYNNIKDTLSVELQNVSLKTSLKKVAELTSLEIYFDDKAETTINITIKNQNIENAIDNLLRGKNYLKQFTVFSKDYKFLTSIIVLPEGKSNSKNAKRLNNIQTEAFIKASRNMSLKQINEIDQSMDRWKARLQKLPPEKRDELEKRATKRAIANKNAEDKNKKQQEDRIKRKQEHARHIDKKRQQRLQGMTEEQISRIEQNEQQYRDQMRAKLLNQLNNK